MDRFVYYSKPKLVASLAPIFGVAVALAWLHLAGDGFWIFAIVWGAMVLATIIHLSPLGTPVLEVGPIELAYGPGLATKLPISTIKYATGGSPARAWPGVKSIDLQMESRVFAGQRYYDQKTIQLFCIDTPIEDVAERINFFVQRAQHD